MSNLKKSQDDLAVARAERDAAQKKLDDAADLVKKASEPARPRNPALAGEVPATPPWGTSGPLSSSRGFRLTKALAVQAGLIDESEAKDDLEACRQFTKALKDAGQFPENSSAKGIHIPLGSDLLADDVTCQTGYKVFKSMWAAGTRGFDRDEAAWLVKSLPDDSVFKKTAMSYLQDTIGGTLVAPPTQGELIELIRPKEALANAGVTRVPLPPNGKVVYPRQTGPTSMYWIGENTSITESNPTTGQIALQAKKGAVFATLPNELLKYASVAADMLVRNDTAKTIALGVDNAGLYGSGSAMQPKGLTLYTGTNEVIQYAGVTPAPKGLGTNGNTLRPEDGYRMIGLLEDRNFEFKGWIFRPSMANNVMGYRADAAAPADAAGGFVQSFMRAVGERMPGTNWVGYPVTKSAVIRNNRAKGSSTTLTEVFGGQWEHLLHGMYGAVEFAASNVAGTTFQQDQTAIRALIHTDFVPRYEGAFVYYDFLTNNVN